MLLLKKVIDDTMRKLLFIHIPKTGGTTVSSLFNRDLNILQINNLPVASSMNILRENLQKEQSANILIHSPLTGHIDRHFGIDYTKRFLANNNIVMTCIRCPSALLESSWKYELFKSEMYADYKNYHLPLNTHMNVLDPEKKYTMSEAVQDYDEQKDSEKISIDSFVNYLFELNVATGGNISENYISTMNPIIKFRRESEEEKRYWCTGSGVYGSNTSIGEVNVQHKYLTKLYSEDLLSQTPQMDVDSSSTIILPTEKLSSTLASILILNKELNKYFDPNMFTYGESYDATIMDYINRKSKNKSAKEMKEVIALTPIQKFKYNRMAYKDMALWLNAMAFSLDLHNQSNCLRLNLNESIKV